MTIIADLIESICIESTTEQQTTTSSPQDGGNSSCPQTNPDQAVYVCPSSFRQDPKDCNQFYQCTQGEDSEDMTVTKFTCPPNTSYNEKECKCDKSQSCPSDSARSLKYLIEPRNMVNSNTNRNVNNACYLSNRKKCHSNIVTI